MLFIAKKFQELNTFELYEILKARAEIFIMEENILYQDLDSVDYESLHCFFLENNRVVAYLRAFYFDDEKEIIKIGRVLTLNHGTGMGRKLIEKSLSIIKSKMNCKKIILHSQKHAIGFYEKFGFQVVSKVFLEAGIPHVSMELEL